MYRQSAEVPLLEYFARLDAIPKNGTTVVIGAIKTRDRTGGPTRILSIMEPDPRKDTSGGAGRSSTTLFSILAYFVLLRFY